ncbi:primary-amine oxidase [Pseudonocardia sp. KRD-184]|uniref:Amine oxidase n=1 Tax=Pseudonocardia oceani TaxID=2792013 RepID=A0ABS6UGU3_9PSEU|nr:primary-amine oxidase [Pseudonocardia oceani]MBW0092191.1 primary-amine oxidase [Pseudonocardia oceani]MBW0098486.1 primary-amine oxidase [Pseudonocardia oceani]MBW0111040.1 primary-amine oxidase [Pseudonocardia oceani]MBW0123629.1 primary-amine oxidase [Pseudonocardia oceani]MBW0131454.1 primary-amine oxidase [Pseudonocardia oceani]
MTAVITGHPLEPLTADEITAATAVLRDSERFTPAMRFVFVALHEPPKSVVLGWSGEEVPREAHLVLYERGTRNTYETVVSLTERAVVAWTHVPGVQPPIMAEEFESCESIVMADSRWQEAMRRRGVEDFSLAMVDPWASSWTGPEDDPSQRRIARPLTWLRSAPGEHGYARPVEGLIVLVDLDAGAVIDVTDHGIVPFPTQAGNYEEPWMSQPGNVPAFDGPRTDVKPIEITQPEGPSFTVDGHAVAWQKWTLRIGFTPREGLVLHQVAYDGRPIVHRASLAEMYVPYGDPAPTHRFKNVFDQGEYGVGWLANSLTLGCDCVGHIHYFDGVVHDNDGAPVVIPNAVCMHEEDAGIAWKHTDFRTGAVQVRRRRRLVVSTIVTVGNYEYGYFWYLYTDGTIEYEVKLTGVISTAAIAPGEVPEHGTLVAPGLYGPNHQHFFCVRLDMTVDGVANTVVEVDSAPSPAGPANPHGNAWHVEKTVLASEAVAQRDVDASRARYWKIQSAERTSALGAPTAYALMPGATVPPMYSPDAVFAPRAGFTGHQLWVTASDDTQRYAAGDYPNQHPGGQGLPAYAAGDRPLEATDVVVWYTFGAHHVVRPEDWPVMPVSTAGFMLKPSGFFDGNPSLDLPASSPHCHS